ncbi:MAG: hypothetical protein K2K55_02445 [Duncaniella sp.]|nr:hypothetical protein [Duncaniella sp.]
MKTKNTKTALIISAQAAARIFLKIAKLELDPSEKCSLINKVSGIIEGRLEIGKAGFSNVAEQEIGAELSKAILRSSKARAAASRRRQSSTASINVLTNPCIPDETSSPVKATEITLPKEEAGPVMNPPADNNSDSASPRRRKRRRRKRRR